MQYNADNYVGKKIRLYPGDTYAKYGVITRVDDLGWTVLITESSCGSYKVGAEYFISHSSIFKFEIMQAANSTIISMCAKLKAIKMRWEKELSRIYGGVLEVNCIDGKYYVCAYHAEPKGGFDAWMETLREFACLGDDESIETECHKLNIPVCHY